MMEPDLQLCGLSIWVKDRQFPDASDYWDGNWLELLATMQSSTERASVTVEGAMLMTRDFEQFRNQLATMHENLDGQASLSGYEPNLKLTLIGDGLGHISGEVEITPDQLNEFHRFDIGGLDQTQLPGLIASLDRILERFPVINWPEG